MLGKYYKKVKNRDIFIYSVDCTEIELEKFKTVLGEHYREDDGTPLLFSRWYLGNSRPIIKYKGQYILESYELFKLSNEFKSKGHNIYGIIDHSVAKDPRVDEIKELWSVNRKNEGNLNSSLFKLPKDLKLKLEKFLLEYNIEKASFFDWSEEKANKEIEEIIYEEKEAWKDYEADRAMDRAARDEIDSWGEEGYWNID